MTPLDDARREQNVTRLITEPVDGFRGDYVGVWDVRSLNPHRLDELRGRHEREFVYASDYDALLADNARLRAEQEAAEGARLKLVADYNELMLSVSNKIHGETRHQTALRYIRQAEQAGGCAGKEVRQ